VISGAFGAISELQLASRLPGLLRWASPPQFWLRSSLFKGLGAKTCHKITPNALVPQGGRSRSESPRRGSGTRIGSYDSLSRFLLDLERSPANQRRGSSLSFFPKNNTSSPPIGQEIVDSFRRADLRALPSNHFEGLKDDRVGQYSIRINEQWRVCFEWPKGDAGPSNVEIVDYR
jgi:hypothetical protein